jgi:hypothetical protein
LPARVNTPISRSSQSSSSSVLSKTRLCGLVRICVSSRIPRNVSASLGTSHTNQRRRFAKRPEMRSGSEHVASKPPLLILR